MIAALLQDLGCSRVAAILDANKRDRILHLSRELPSFHFVAIPADDVRTKAAQPARQPVEGLVDADGQLRPEFETQTRHLFEEVAAYIARPQQ